MLTKSGQLKSWQGCSHCWIWADLWSALFLFSWTGPKGAVGSHSLNSCHQVGSLFLIWVNLFSGMTSWELHFGMGINVRSIPSSLPIFHVIFLGCSWNRSAECPYLRVQRKSCDLDRAPKMLDSVLLKSWESFLVTLPSTSSETCVLCILQWF